MTKHAKKTDHLQLVDAPKTTTVEIPSEALSNRSSSSVSERASRCWLR
jgi:hypothetical protein